MYPKNLHAKLSSALSKFFNPSLKPADFRKFIETNRKKITYSSLAALVFAALFGIFSIYRSSMQKKYSAILHESMIEQQTGNLGKSLTLLKEVYEAKMAPSGVKSIAALRYGALLNEEGKREDALEIYLKLSKCFSCDNFIRELSALLAARTIAADESKIKDPKTMSQLQEIENSTKILRYHIAQQRAIISFLNNDFQTAYQISEVIAKASDARESLKSKANDLISLVKEKGYEPNQPQK